MNVPHVAQGLSAWHFTISTVEKKCFQPLNPRYAIPCGGSDLIDLLLQDPTVGMICQYRQLQILSPLHTKNYFA